MKEILHEINERLKSRKAQKLAAKTHLSKVAIQYVIDELEIIKEIVVDNIKQIDLAMTDDEWLIILDISLKYVHQEPSIVPPHESWLRYKRDGLSPKCAIIEAYGRTHELKNKTVDTVLQRIKHKVI